MPPPRSLPEASSIGGLQRALATSLTSLLIIAGVALTPVADVKLMPIPSYMLAFGSAMLITNLLLAGLLFSRGRSERNGAATHLGTAYFFVASIFVPMMAAFPDAIQPGSLIGSKFSAVWIWSFWHAGFGLLVLRYVRFVGRGRTRPWGGLVDVAATLGIVAVVVAVSTTWIGALPDIFGSRAGLFDGWGRVPPLATLAIDLLAFFKLQRLRDPTPDQLWLGVGMIAACFDVWLTMRGGARFTVGWYVSKLGSLFTTGAVLVSLFDDLTGLYRRVSASNAMLTDQAHRDGLTGIANRRKFDDVFAIEWSRASRGGYPISLLMVDVDWFKQYNDVYGHLEGDECLREIAQLLESSSKRPSDLACRYGGEEFAVILPMTDTDGATVLAGRLRDALSVMEMPHGASPLGRVTISVGVSCLRPLPGVEARHLIAAADRALYLAKHSGRDCARTHAHEPRLELVRPVAVA
jgi:diguanylate cyclase (GGDEF)-like protein